MENSIGNLKWLALNLEIALYSVDTEQDPVVFAESSNVLYLPFVCGITLAKE